MKPKTDKFDELIAFIDDLDRKKGDIARKLDAARTVIQLQEREKLTIESILPFGLEKEKKAREEQAADPKNALLAETVMRLTEANKTAEIRLANVVGALEQAKSELIKLEVSEAALDYATLAESAVDEQFGEIVRLQGEFTGAIRAAENLRQEYLKSLVKVGHIRSMGNHAVERLQRAMQHCPQRTYPQHAQFETNLTTNFSVDLSDIKAAYYRAKV